MLTIKKDHTFKWPVRVQIPNNSGSFDVQTFQCHFKSLTQDELDERLSGAADNIDFELLEEVLVSADDIKDEDGKRLDFDDEVKNLLLSIPYIRTSMAETYFAAMSGRQPQRKNSKGR